LRRLVRRKDSLQPADFRQVLSAAHGTIGQKGLIRKNRLKNTFVSPPHLSESKPYNESFRCDDAVSTSLARGSQGHMSRQYIYQIERLTKKHGPKEVLKEIWLSFYPGAKIGVLGNNGAGKSTLLRIMAGQD
jgi:ABC-type bacteriocin/lantibiotic exporter with double-glycine peptidase domain